MYFAQLPKINYRLSGNPYKEVVKSVNAVDITAGARIVRGAVRDITILDRYRVRDFETPEIVAEIIWGAPEWHWLVLLLNDIFHPSDWVLSSRDFEEMIIAKYGDQGASQRIAFYRDHSDLVTVPDPFAVNSQTITPSLDYNTTIGFPFIRWYNENNVEVSEPESADTVAGLDAVTYYEYESELNESKREIKIVGKATADAIVSQFKAQMGGVS